mmetsp:Transcript_35972/g.95474  ORF Transcript_35972/g.95474 Transcript_35972/m.95474 type:complete len:329 (-) Transcript_35972:473-1459(-)
MDGCPPVNGPREASEAVRRARLQELLSGEIEDGGTAGAEGLEDIENNSQRNKYNENVEPAHAEKSVQGKTGTESGEVPPHDFVAVRKFAPKSRVNSEDLSADNRKRRKEESQISRHPSQEPAGLGAPKPPQRFVKWPSPRQRMREYMGSLEEDAMMTQTLQSRSGRAKFSEEELVQMKFDNEQEASMMAVLQAVPLDFLQSIGDVTNANDIVDVLKEANRNVQLDMEDGIPEARHWYRPVKLDQLKAKCIESHSDGVKSSNCSGSSSQRLDLDAVFASPRGDFSAPLKLPRKVRRHGGTSSESTSFGQDSRGTQSSASRTRSGLSGAQ